MREFEYALDELIEDFIVLDVDHTGLGDFTRRLQKLIYRFRLKVPGPVFLLLRSLAILEGVTKTLDPSFNALEAIKPYGFKVLKEEFSPNNISTDVYYSFTRFVSLLYNLPQETRDIIKKLKKGQLHTNVELHGYDRFLDRLDLITNKLVLGFLTSAVLIASAIVMNAPLSSALSTSGGVSYISILGFILAGVFGFLLFISMIRNGR